MALITDPQVLRDNVSRLSWGSTPEEFAKLVGQLREALSARQEDILRRFREQSGFRSEDVQELWRATLGFIDGLPRLLAARAALEASRTTLPSAWESAAHLEFAPHGRVLLCLPANAPLPLAVIAPLGLLVSGNAVAVAPSRRTAGAALAIASLVQEAFPERVALWDGRVTEALEALVSHRSVDLVYFIGGSGPYAEIAAQCAATGVDLLYEGEGNGVAVVTEGLPEEELTRAVEDLLAAKAFCNGAMCSAPNAIAIPRRELERFTQLFDTRSRRHMLPAPLRKLAGPAWAWLEERLRAGAGHWPSGGGSGDGHHPLLVLEEELDAALRTELFCPAAFAVPYDGLPPLIQRLASLPHKLQVSIFTAREEDTRRLLRGTSFARYCINMNPAYQDPLLPWGNHGRSGTSPVEDFIGKGCRVRIVESGRSTSH